MSNAHGTSSLLLALSLIFGAASMAACDTSDEATRTRRGDDHCKTKNCEPEPTYPDDSCVMTQDRWVAQSFAAPEQRPQFTGELCGMSYDDILTAPRATPWMKVAQQYVTTQANLANGASLPNAVADALAEAEDFLSYCFPCPGVSKTTAPSLQTLKEFNAGKIGSSSCECAYDCDECAYDCDPDDDLEWCPPTEFDYRTNY